MNKKKLIEKYFFILTKRLFIEKLLNKLNLSSNHLEQYDLIYYRNIYEYEDLSAKILFYDYECLY